MFIHHSIFFAILILNCIGSTMSLIVHNTKEMNANTDFQQMDESSSQQQDKSSLSQQLYNQQSYLPRYPTQQQPMQKDHQYDTIIIGAGISGVSAAHDLALGKQKVLILQANDYIGGRMKSVSVKMDNGKSMWFQQGANWIHGRGKSNPLTSLANKIPNVKLLQTDDDSSVTYDQKGKQIDKQVDKQWDQYEEIMQKVESFSNLSVKEAIKKINPSKLQQPKFMYHVANDIEFQTSSEINDLSAQYAQDDQEFQGGDYLVVSGFQQWVEYLAKEKEEAITLLLNHTVSEVVRDDKTGFSVVTCSNGKKFQAKNVIITVPLNVLKKGFIKFKPQLPQWKSDAIQKLHMGNICKILIVFKKNIKITDKEQYIGIVSNDVEKRGAATYFLNLHSLTKSPALMTFGLGPNSDELQLMSQPQLKLLLTKRLNVFTETTVTVNDFDIYRSSWRNNSNFGGAYTYSGVQSRPKHWENIAKPIFDCRWYFCGQHTHSKYRGTVHGALLSGRDVALDIIKEVNEKDWKYKGKS